MLQGAQGTSRQYIDGRRTRESPNSGLCSRLQETWSPTSLETLDKCRSGPLSSTWLQARAWNLGPPAVQFQVQCTSDFRCQHQAASRRQNQARTLHRRGHRVDWCMTDMAGLTNAGTSCSGRPPGCRQGCPGILRSRPPPGCHQPAA